jgi:hypothetical protein
MNDRTAAGAGGREPPPRPARADPIAGELITETFEYDGGRQVTVYVPPDPPEAVVFARDGDYSESSDCGRQRCPYFNTRLTRRDLHRWNPCGLIAVRGNKQRIVSGWYVAN